jgi:hypothetical protein
MFIKLAPKSFSWFETAEFCHPSDMALNISLLIQTKRSEKNIVKQTCIFLIDDVPFGMHITKVHLFLLILESEPTLPR